jgi:hypothetical protein
MSDTHSSWSAWARAVVIVVAIILAFAVFWMLFAPWVTLWLSSETFSYVVDNVVDVSGISPYLVKGMVLVALIPFGWSVAEILKFGIWDRLRGMAGYRSNRWITKRFAVTVVVAYGVAYFFVMYAASRGQNFRHTAGAAQRWYAITPEGIRFFDSSGFDPKYGLKLEPVTAELAVNLARAERGQTPSRLVVNKLDDIQFFDTLSGQPRIWYFKNAAGEVELYSQAGHHPAYGDQLRPITREVVSALRQQLEANAKQVAVEHAAAVNREERARAEASRIAVMKQHEQQVDQYTNRSTDRSMAVVFVDDGRFDHESAMQLASRVGGSSALFKPTFVTSGMFEAALNGDATVLRKLDLEGRATSIVLGRLSTRAAVASVVGSEIHKSDSTLTVRVFVPEDHFSSQSFSVIGHGSGFTADEAKKHSVEDAITHVATRLR